MKSKSPPPYIDFSPKYTRIGICLIVLATTILKFGFHELWKDEWQSWFVVRDMDFLQMLRFLYYEGHPALWYLYQKIFTLFTPWIAEDILIKSSHLILYLIFVWIIYIWKGVPALYKLLLLSGYFFSFEYAVVSRGYILVLLLSAYLLQRWSTDKQTDKFFYLALILLCNTEFFGLFAAGGITLMVLWERAFSGENKFNLTSVIRENTPLLLSLFIGAFVCYITLNWAEDASEIRNRLFSLMHSMENKSGGILSAQGIFGNGFLPGIIPDAHSQGISLVYAAIGGLIFGISIWMLSGRNSVLLAYFSIFTLMFGFAAFGYAGGLRQWGLLFCIFALLYLYSASTQTSWGIKDLIFIIFLIIQVQYTIRAFYKEVAYPYTHAKAAGEFIKAKVPEKVPVVMIDPFHTAAPQGYASRVFYSLPEGNETTYFRWLDKVYIPDVNDLRLFAGYKNVGGIIVITHRRLDAAQYPGLVLWTAFDSFSIKGESYYLYTFKR